jgi:hypothetical protein
VSLSLPTAYAVLFILKFLSACCRQFLAQVGLATVYGGGNSCRFAPNHLCSFAYPEIFSAPVAGGSARKSSWLSLPLNNKKAHQPKPMRLSFFVSF